LKFVSLIEVYIAETSKEAHAKLEETLQYINDDGAQVLFGGWTGVGLSEFDHDEDLRKVGKRGTRSHLKSLLGAPKKITKRDLTDKITGRRSSSTFVGSVKEVADQIEELVDKSGIDGFNFAYSVWPGSFEDIVDLLIPELRKRGLAWDD